MLHRLATALGLQHGYFFEGLDVDGTASYEKAVFSRSALETMRYLQAIPPKHRQRVMKLAQAMAGADMGDEA